MTSTAFAVVLTEPDNDASNSALHQLIAAREFSGSTLPTAAESYLRAFCDAALSITRRRWVGLALAGMIEASAPVVAHLGASRHELHALGAIVLSNAEREETKIVAGLIIRQAIDRGIEYNSFWTSDKITNSAPNFPAKTDGRWMASFQAFLDTLDELALASQSDEPSIIFPVSIVASDGFRWRDSDTGCPVALIQAGLLTVIAQELEELQFVDIPLNHIQSMHSHPSKLHDSQARQTGHEPWDLVLTLNVQPWSYRLDSSIRTGAEITFLFQHSGDAHEWESCIKQHQRGQEASMTVLPPKTHPMMSRTSPIDASSSPHRTRNGTDTQLTLQSASKTHHIARAVSQELIATSSDPIAPQSLSQPPHDELPAGPVETGHDDLNSSKQMGPIRPASKGKLPSVSQAIKVKAFKQLRAPSDVFDIPAERTGDRPANSPSASGSPSPKQTKGSKAACSHVAANGTTKGRKSQTKRKADDDDDEFVPEGKRTRSKTSAKRKAEPNAVVEDKQPKRKARIVSTLTATGPATAGPTKVKKVSNIQQPKPRPPRKPPSSVASPRHSLIGGLLGSQRPAKISSVSFKKPKLPVRAAQTPSTPTRPRIRPVELLGRPQTPMGARRRPNDEPLPHMPSSPPTGHVTVDGGDWVEQTAAEQEILSSNSKPVPASPNAESTAISGHADREDVASEKQRGESQIAKSDPFQQGRDGKQATFFTRRLTGEDPANAKLDLGQGPSHSMPTQLAGSSTAEVEALSLTTASQPLPQSMPWQKKLSGPSEAGKFGAYQRTELTNLPKPPTLPRKDRFQVTEPLSQQDSKRVAEYMSDEANRRVSLGVAPDQTEGSTSGYKGGNLTVHMEDSIAAASQQAIDNHIEQSSQICDDAFTEGDNTLVNYDEDEPAETKLKASPIHFRSSPPIPGSSSSHSSTSAEYEPVTEPLLPSPEAEEMEWEANLQPHQRALHDLLIRTTKRVVRYIIDNETAVTDIVEIFARDGEHVLNSLVQRQGDDYNHVFEDLEGKRKGLRKELEIAAKQMAKEKQRVIAMA
ncbi:hypothetical protein EJ02DRAFT_42580 [Clathrospora elynae]|uniref:Uncharacterized protein n=1 Tax=Clathrospora elynae TaxID=706981 RepID=A0A6A5T914_9PLEO|nr:hypothetical protein EJ02DRAFT_42580 [Clathrospora elynae]